MISGTLAYRPETNRSFADNLGSKKNYKISYSIDTVQICKMGTEILKNVHYTNDRLRSRICVIYELDGASSDLLRKLLGYEYII